MTPVSTHAIIVLLSLLGVLELGSGISSAAGCGNVAVTQCRSQWPRGLGRRSAAARSLGLWVRIPQGAWISFVSVVCCRVEVSASDWSLVRRSPTECGVF